MNNKIKAIPAIVNILLLGLSLTCIYPLIWLGYSSMKTDNDFLSNLFALPGHIEWNNYYMAVVKSRIYAYFFNTIFNAVTSVAIILVLSFCIGYFLCRYNFKGKGFINLLLTLGMIVPVHSLLVPMYIQFKLLGMVDKRGVLILPYLGVMLPLAVFLIEAYVKTIPVELEQSAGLEGASLFTILTKIIVPISKPILITVIILTFNFVWNEMPFALILNASENVRNIAVGIMNFSSSYDTKWTQRIAACVVAVFPVLIIYIFFNKQIIQGMTEGSIKG